ncbi:MAG: UPF0146 family protein [Candidatus Hadarchaeota archaeon]|nr:UPF0146 family protein [Candidatus Hadarchaeota archaeon]
MEELRTIAGYIAENYGSAVRIVEVGVGKVPETVRELRRLLPKCQLVVTDIEEPEELPGGVKFVRDDVTVPNVQIYEGASLVYSIRPPSELQPSLFKIARKVGADLLIKSIAGEEALEGGGPVNYQGTTFHLFRAERD